MRNHHSVEHRIEKVRNVFHQTLYISTESDDSIAKHLESIDPEFRAVAYEGMAMALASKDLVEGNHLQRWRSFMRTSDQRYEPHLHVGLGWAIAKRKTQDLLFLDSLNPLMLYRVLDGCGYYDGMFKQNQVIHNKVRPEYIDENKIDAYYEGIGRSLWSICKGDSMKVDALIQGFSPSHHADLWRGVGIACSFVGGCSETTLHELFSSASEHRLQLAVGAAIVAKSRIQTNSLTEDSERACRVWCNLSAKQAKIVAEEPSYAIVPDDAYKQWLIKIESQLLHTLSDTVIQSVL